VKCPKCGLINPDSALRCDCGFDFATGRVKQSYLSQSQPSQPPEGAGQSTNRSSISILVVILSAGTAVGLLVFMWQFLMDLHPFVLFFFLCLSLVPLIAGRIWRQLGCGLSQLWRVILGFLFTSAVGVILTVSISLVLPGSFGYGYWIEAWEGRVVEKYTYKDEGLDDELPRTVYAVDLTTGHKKRLRRSEWDRVEVGDYIVKKRRSYTIERLPHVPPKKSGQAEVFRNLDAIRTCQERYFSEHGVYLECKVSPPHGGTDVEPDQWMDEGGFSEIDFEPSGKVLFQYAVEVSDDGQSFIATATGDLDEDGEKVIWTLDSRADTYPKKVKLVKTGDDY